MNTEKRKAQITKKKSSREGTKNEHAAYMANKKKRDITLEKRAAHCGIQKKKKNSTNRKSKVPPKNRRKT